MDKITLKPSISKIIISWLTMSFVVIAITVLLNLNEFTDLIALAFTISIMLVQVLVFTIIFYSLPYFKIEINDSHLVGPRSLGWGWMKAKIPVNEIDLTKTNSTFQWLGLYIIKSNKGEKISIWGFDEKQFKKLMDLLKSK